MKKFIKIAAILSVINLFFLGHVVSAEELSSEQSVEVPIVLTNTTATGESEQEINQAELPISIHLTITNATAEIYNQEISVLGCDSDNNIETINTITAYCAILQTELPSEWNWDWAPSAFIDSLSGIAGYTSKDAENNNVYHYWSWSLNGEYANDALNQYLLKEGDVVTLEFIDPEVPHDEDEEPVVIDQPISVNLLIKTATSTLYQSQISVLGCDSDNNIETINTITAYCAILQTELPSEWNWDWAPSAFIDSLSGIAGYTSKDAENNNVYHYWSWSLNGEYANDALNQYLLKEGDVVTLEFIDPATSTSNGSGGVIDPGSQDGKSISDALDEAILFLSKEQKSDGSFGVAFYTDWVAIGISQATNADEIKSQVLNNLLGSKYNPKIATDLQRRAMVYLALGLNPATETEINYIEKITALFDGEQIGDPDLINDDIFGLLVLSKAGFNYDDEIIKKVINQIIVSQSSNGSWESVDLTAAAIQALNNYKGEKIVNKSLNTANQFLINNQETDGGYGNTFSTSWAIQALSISDDESQAINQAVRYLKNNQMPDGGYPGANRESRIWATAYAIPALMKLSWNDILASFEKEERDVPGDNNSPIDQEENEEAEVLDVPLSPTLNTVPSVLVLKENIVEAVNQNVRILNRASPRVENPHEVNLNSADNLLTASVGSIDQNGLTFKTIIAKLGAKIKALWHFLWDSWQF